MKVWASALAILLMTIPGETQVRDGGPLPGEAAPDFTLNTKDGQRQVTLHELTGRPTVLIFASYT